MGFKVCIGRVTVVWVESSADQVVVANDSNPIRVAIKLGWSQSTMLGRTRLLDEVNCAVSASAWLAMGVLENTYLQKL